MSTNTPAVSDFPSMDDFWVLQDLDYSQSLPENLTSLWTLQSLDSRLNKSCLDLYIPGATRNCFTWKQHEKQNKGADKLYVKEKDAQYACDTLSSSSLLNSEAQDVDFEMKDELSGDIQHTRNNSSDVTSDCQLQNYVPQDHMVPLVVFVHGGGWRRGHKEGWRHYASIYDMNLLVAGFLKFFWIFGNVGKTFAQNGIACAVISYPLVRLSFPWLLLEVVSSMFMSWLTCAPPVVLALAVVHLASLWGCCNSLIGSMNWPYLSLVLLILALSQVVSWLVMVTFNHGSHLPHNIRKIISRIIVILWTTLILLLLLNMLSLEVVIFLLCPVTVGLVQGTSICTFVFNVKVADSYKDQAASIAASIRWLVELGKKSDLFNPNCIFLMGHSAGAHLSSLVTLDSVYLDNVGCPTDTIKGVIGVSGVYNIEWLKGPIFRYLYLNPVFGSDPKGWKIASPIHCLPTKLPDKVKGLHQESKILDRNEEKQTVPPFLLFSAQWDLALSEQTKEFVDKLHEHSDSGVNYQIVSGTNHFTIMVNFGREQELDEMGNTMEELCFSFIQNTLEKHKSMSSILSHTKM